VRKACERRGLPVDIEWDDSRRIYGSDWSRFLEDANATLGTESGSNVFDEHGAIRAAIEQAQREDPGVTYAQIRERFLEGEEGRIRMNQISPKIFEAIACRTALVLFEGDYSGVIKPGRHYLSLKKDFSNLDEILGRLQDHGFLEELTARAYRDIIESGRYSYGAFVYALDEVLAGRIRRPRRGEALGVMRVQWWFNGRRWRPVAWPSPVDTFPTTGPLAKALRTASPRVSDSAVVVRLLWHAIPVRVRKALAPFVNATLKITRLKIRARVPPF
jgi:hypothetical protein